MPPAAPPSPPTRHRGLRPALVLLLVVALLLVALAGTGWWVLRRDSGTSWLLGQVPGLRVTGPKGTLLGDFDAERIDLQLPDGGQLSLQGAGWRGLRIELGDGRQRLRIVIDRIAVARVDLRPGTSEEPLRAPTNLELPIELIVGALQVQQFHAAPLGETPLRDLQARLHLSAETGTRHRLDAVSFAFDRLRASGALAIGTLAPLPLQTRLELGQDGTAAGASWSAQASLAGPLAAPALRATVRAQPVAAAGAPTPAPQSLDLAATLRPFEPWPLGDLQASAKALDLAAFHSAAPATSLSGEAQARTQGRDQPASLTAKLVNAAAGRWNDARLPLRQLQLELVGRPDDTGRFELRAFDAELGHARQPGGRLSGKGRWGPEGWSLETTLTALQPDALDARAPAMQLSGPLRLNGGVPAAASGPLTVELKADIAGRMTTRGPARAVQWRLDAAWRSDAQSQGLEVREALASAGAARARLAGTASRAANAPAWQVKGQAALIDFDPRPWWPGREDSPWRQGPHRLNAQADADLALPAALLGPATPSTSASGPASTPARRPEQADPLAALRGRAQLVVRDSVLAGVPITGAATLRQDTADATDVALKFDAAGNAVSAQGRIARRANANANADQWEISIGAPALDRLAPLWRLVRGNAQAALGGNLNASLRLDGRWPATLTSRGQASASALRVDQVAVRSATARWQVGTRLDGPVEALAELAGITVGQGRLESARVDLKGTGRAHSLEMRAESTLRPPAWADSLQAAPASAPTAGTPTAGAPTAGSPTSVARLSAEGGFTEAAGGTGAGGWRGTLKQIELRSARAEVPAWLRSGDVALALRWADDAPLQAELQPGRAEVLGATLRWDRVAWRAGDASGPAQIEAKAVLDPLPVAPLLARLQPNFGWGGDLTLVGRLAIRSAPSFTAEVLVERGKGDLNVTDETGTQALGLTDLRLVLEASNGVWSFSQGLAGSTLGVAAGAVVARTTPTQTWPPADTPIEGVLDLRVANLGTWGTWVPAGWRLGGELRTSASIGGRFGAPEYTGEIRGHGLSVRNFLQGVSVSDGDVAIELRGASARIETFSARAGEGTLKVEGNAVLGAAPQAQLRLLADKAQLLGRVDRRIVASGQAQVRLDRETLALAGRFGVDEGLIDFTRTDAPGLSDDVVVVRNARNGAPAQAAAPPAAAASEPIVRETPLLLPKTALDLRVDLGERLRVRGRGLDTGLRGELHLSSPGGRLAVNGTVRAVDGTYAAYGQKLVIDRGELVFNGPAENPRLDIEATRPNIDVRAGVAVSGSAANPRVRLFSEPELSDIDKLSWLVLGRASDGLGRTDTALLQRAALALLAGEGPGASDQLIGAIGLDELSLRQSDGEVRETIVTLGKQLSRRWYVGYERSLNATAGTWQLIYRIAQRFTLRAQSGEDNSLDAIWTWRWQ